MTFAVRESDDMELRAQRMLLEKSIREKHALLRSLWRLAWRHRNPAVRRQLARCIRPLAYLQRDLRAHRQMLARTARNPLIPAGADAH